MEFTIPVGMGPPPHIHDQDELVYIIDGTARFHHDGVVDELGPGSVLFVPRGTAETFEPTSTLRLLTVYSPGAIDRFFAEVGEPAERREVPPAPSTPPDIERITAVGARHGLQLLPPA